MSDYFCGVVQGITFKNVEKSFYIFRIVDEETEKTVTARGTIVGMQLDVGSWIGFEGKWERHEKYGKQIKISKAPVVRGDWSPGRIVRVLSSRGVMKLTLHELRAKFKKDLSKALEDPSKIMEVKGISKMAAEDIHSKWMNTKALFETLDTMGQLDLPSRTMDLIWGTYGDEAKLVLSQTPWKLVEIPGVSFSKADSIAVKLGCDMGSPERVKGAVHHSILRNKSEGNMFIQGKTLYGKALYLLPGLKVPQFAKALEALCKEGKAVLNKDFGSHIYEPELFNLEQDSASLLASRIKSQVVEDGAWRRSYVQKLGNVGDKTKTHSRLNPEDVGGTSKVALKEWLDRSGVNLSESQFQGAWNALKAPVSILTGGPGTGKTFTLKTVVKVLQEAEVPLLLTAPTGIAAKRIQEVTGAEAFTIHRAFKASGASDGQREATYSGIVGESGALEDSTDVKAEWGFGLGLSHPAEVLVVDETSMVDQHLMYRLLSCTSARCRVVFVGDDAQLPSVGPGNVLRDLISSGRVPTTKLTEIFRQQDTSDIVIAAHDINSGKHPQPTPGKDDYIFLEQEAEDTVLQSVLKTAQKLYNTGKNFQVLSPKHRGALGVTNLNENLRSLLNPQTPGLEEMRIAGGVLREGDRVMVVKNDYNYGIFNGDVGKVMAIDREAKVVKVKIWGSPDQLVFLAMKDVSRYLRLAYAVTVHKCLAPGTLVETPEGLQKIEALPGEGLIATPDGFKPYRNKVENPSGPMLKIRTVAGYEITATLGHGFQASSEMGGPVRRVEASELRVGDYLKVRFGTYIDHSDVNFLGQLLEGAAFELSTTSSKRLIKGVRDPGELQKQLQIRYGIRALRKEGGSLLLNEPDFGRILEADPKPKYRGDFSEKIASITSCESPSYCVEVPDGHQFLQNGFHGWNCQGNEYDFIVMPWVEGFKGQLQRNLIYTAVTRAKEKVILFGHQEAMRKSVGTVEAMRRETNLPRRLIKELEQDEPTPLSQGSSPEEYQRENPNF